MEYIIKNEFITAKINSKGAELRELIDSDGINRMHVPNVNTWNRVSPILFPQISKTKDFLYQVNHKDYYMPMHGFFRNEEHFAISQTSTKLVFLMKDSEETLKIYPYHFEFLVTYELIKSTLKVSFEIINKGDKMMYYMIGGHPGFKVPLFENENYNDYYLKFKNKETVKAMQVVNGYLANEFKDALQDEDKIVLKHEMYNPDAIILKDLSSPYVDLLSIKNDKALRFHFNDFDILAIWSLMLDDANFVCLEPWNGIQQDFVLEHEKMGVLSIEPQGKQKFSYSIEILK